MSVFPQELDYEKKDTYTFIIDVKENNLKGPADNQDEKLLQSVDVIINVIDVDEPPLFSKEIYNFSIAEHSPIKTLVGKVSAIDPDKANFAIRYVLYAGFNSCNILKIIISTTVFLRSIFSNFLIAPIWL